MAEWVRHSAGAPGPKKQAKCLSPGGQGETGVDSYCLPEGLIISKPCLGPPFTGQEHDYPQVC